VITRYTKVQLLVFCIITLLGVSFVGAKYARLDRLVRDDTFTVVAHFADAGGAFEGAQVTYRGVEVGRVEEMRVTEDGVDLRLGVSRDQDRIPADALAVVGNRSAVGEQYVELQPRGTSGPYLREGSSIARRDTRLPTATDTLLTHLSETVSSVDTDDLSTVVGELGTAFGGSGRDLQTIIDTGTSLLETADDNFELTTSLLRGSNTVLKGQVASESALRSFARDMSLFSGTLAASDADLRRLIDTGSATATQLRTFLEENEVELGQLLNNLVTTGEVVVKRLDGVEQLLAIYPYVVEGGFTVVAKDPHTGKYDAHFGLVLTEFPAVCHGGYQGTRTRPPQEGSDVPMNTEASCTEPASKSNARGSAHAPRRAGVTDREPVAAYDPRTGEVTWGASAARLAPVGRPAPRALGEESWKWLYLEPLTLR